MRNYEVYFEAFGRKLRTTVLAENESHAKKLVLEKIKFDNVAVKKGDAFNESVELMDKIHEALSKIT